MVPTWPSELDTAAVGWKLTENAVAEWTPAHGPVEHLSHSAAGWMGLLQFLEQAPDILGTAPMRIF